MPATRKIISKMSEGLGEEKKIGVIVDELCPTLETRVWILENNVRYLLHELMKVREEAAAEDDRKMKLKG